mmetsp:Transcript_9716/g.24557  ORF Transcript_9716/g.24557 Transcript_9716/m.24557 type:complete len:730 (+) Transcript_9716:195-2384(+)
MVLSSVRSSSSSSCCCARSSACLLKRFVIAISVLAAFLFLDADTTTRMRIGRSMTINANAQTLPRCAADNDEVSSSNEFFCEHHYATLGQYATATMTIRFQRGSEYKRGIGITRSVITYPVEQRCVGTGTLHTYTGSGLLQRFCRFRNGTAELADADKKIAFPVVSFAHGSGAPVEVYESTYKQFASHGIIVISTKNPSSNPVDIGNDLVHQLMHLVKLNDQPSSIFYQRIDTKNFGTMGHSMGGGAALNAGVSFGCDPDEQREYCIKTTLGDHPAPFSNSLRLGIPIFLTSGSTDPLTPPATVRGMIYAPSQFPKALAIIRGGHLEPVDFAGRRRWTAWQTAWVVAYLKGNLPATWLIWGDGSGTMRGDTLLRSVDLDPQVTLSLDRASVKLAPGHSVSVRGHIFSNVPAPTPYRLWTFTKHGPSHEEAMQLSVAVSPKLTDELQIPLDDMSRDDGGRVQTMDERRVRSPIRNWRARFTNNGRRRLQQQDFMKRAREWVKNRRQDLGQYMPPQAQNEQYQSQTMSNDPTAPTAGMAGDPTAPTAGMAGDPSATADAAVVVGGEPVEVVLSVGLDAMPSEVDVVIGATNQHDGASTAFATIQVEVVRDPALSDGGPSFIRSTLGPAAHLGEHGGAPLRPESRPTQRPVTQQMTQQMVVPTAPPRQVADPTAPRPTSAPRLSPITSFSDPTAPYAKSSQASSSSQMSGGGGGGSGCSCTCIGGTCTCPCG